MKVGSLLSSPGDYISLNKWPKCAVLRIRIVTVISFRIFFWVKCFGFSRGLFDLSQTFLSISETFFLLLEATYKFSKKWFYLINRFWLSLYFTIFVLKTQPLWFENPLILAYFVSFSVVISVDLFQTLTLSN